METKDYTKVSEEDIATAKKFLGYTGDKLADWRRHSDPKAHHSKKCLDCFTLKALPWLRVMEQTNYFDSDTAKANREKDRAYDKKHKIINK